MNTHTHTERINWLKTGLSYEPATPLWLYIQKMKLWSQRNIHTPMLIAELFTTVKIWKQPSVCQQMNGDIYIYIKLHLLYPFIHWIIQSPYCLLVCWNPLFLHDSVLVGCMFLGIYLFFLDYPNYWHTVAHSSLFMILCISLVMMSPFSFPISFISDFSFFLVLLLKVCNKFFLLLQKISLYFH